MRRRLLLILASLLFSVGCGEVSSREIDGRPADADIDGPPPDAPIDALAIDAPIDGQPVDAPFDAAPPRCGDGVRNGSEVCDDGANNGMYGFCNANCTALGPRCGDGVQNGPETCDSGSNNGMYGFCNTTCTALGPRCGDSVVNGPETCDSGVNNGTYGFCNATCTALGPRCGDGVQNGPETCDSGSNNGMYGFCNTTCTALGPRCGDGVQNGPESCDSGANNGMYGFCNTACTALGPRCGDSIVNGPETCDQGTVYSQTMPAGVCRPDCAGTVQQKTIQWYATRVAPAQGGVSGADSLCSAQFGTNFRAMVVDGTNRIATVTPNAGDGQVGWVIAPYTRYLSAETGALVFVTDNTRLIGASGGVDRDLLAPIHSDDGWGAWVGANSDWTSSTSDCQNWTSSASTDFGLSCNSAATTTGTFPNNGSTSNCGQLRHFFCVQQ